MRMTTDGLAALSLSFEEVWRLRESGTMDRMLRAGGEVLTRAEKETGRAYGVELTGETIGSIGLAKIGHAADGSYIYVQPEGINHKGNRNAEVAFINEFGKKGQPPRPFIRDGNERGADEAVDAAMAIYNDWVSSNGL